MSARRLLCLVLLSVVALGTRVMGLTNTLEELIAEKGIIMPADLAAAYPDAEAVIILSERQIEQKRIIDPVYISYHFVVKILKESAIEKLRTVKIPYYEQNKIDDIQARTINGNQIIDVRNIDNRKIDLKGADADFVIPLEQYNTLLAVRDEEFNTNPGGSELLKIYNNALFHNKGVDIWRIRQIDFPQVQVGSVLEYYWKNEQKRVVLIDHYYFQKKYPVLKSTYNAYNSKMFHILYEFSNFLHKPEMVFEPRFTNQEEQFNLKIRDALRTIDVAGRPDLWQFFGHQYLSVSLDTLQALPANLPFLPVYQDISPRIDMFLRNATNIWESTNQNYRMRPENFGPDWNFVMRRVHALNTVVERKARRSKDEVGKLISSLDTPEKKVSAAVEWTRKNITDDHELERWQSFFWSYEAADPDVVLIHKQGNAADINFFLVSALQVNELPVFPTYLKSRDKGMLLRRVFTETQLNVPLMALQIARRTFKFYQAATDIPLPPDYVDYRCEGVMSYIDMSMDTDIGFQNMDVPVTPAAQNASSISGTLSLSADGTISGSLKEEVTGHLSARLRRQLINNPEQDRSKTWLSNLTGTFTQAELNGAAQMDDLNQPVNNFKVSGNVSLKGMAHPVDGGLAIKTALVTDPVTSVLDGGPRSYPIALPHLMHYISVVELKVPQGYALPETLPGETSTGGGGLKYNLKVSKKGTDTLVFERNFDALDLYIRTDTYEQKAAAVFSGIRQADFAEIVLPKI